MPVALALDVGDVRIGVATGSTEARLARPLAVWRSRGRAKDAAQIVETARRLGAELLVVGLPLQEDGLPGAQADRIRRYLESMSGELPVPVVFVDETLSTQDAQAYLLAGGSRRVRRQGLEDATAAAVILQRYFDSLPAHGTQHR